MFKKGKISSNIEQKKNYRKTTIGNNKKKESHSKRKTTFTKSVEKKKKLGLYTEPRIIIPNFVIESKLERDKKLYLSKPRKDNSINTRSARINKEKGYENNLTEYNNFEREKDFDFFNSKYGNDAHKKKLNSRGKSNNEESLSKTTNLKAKKLLPIKNEKSDQDLQRIKKMQKNTIITNYDDSNDEDSEKDDFLHRPFYKPTIENKRPDNEKKQIQKKTEEKEKDKERKKEKAKNRENEKRKLDLSFNNANDNLFISMEKTDDIHYNIEDKKIYSNKNNNKNSRTRKGTNLQNERAIDFFVVDGEEEVVVSTKNRKKIDRKRNKFKEVIIEKYDASTPVKVEKFTGFILTRRSKGKKVYDLQLEDNIDKVNDILKNNEIKIKGEIIQFIPLEQLLRLKFDVDNYKNIISELQNELKARDYSKEMDKNKDKDREKDKQISALKSKNEELNNLLKKQEQQIVYYGKEMKQIQLSYDLLKESIQNLGEENKTSTDLNQPNKPKKEIPKRINQIQNQKNIKDIKRPMKNYNNELKKVPTRAEDEEDNANYKPKDSELNNEGEDDPDYDQDFMVGEGGPNSMKMKTAVRRFTNKYKDVIKEEKKAQKEREREEKQRLENEEQELEDDEDLKNNEKQKEEKERIEREKREKERERQELERKERERKEREERERKEREKKEREERERREKERKEKEERDKKEREKRERERKERERKEREERERKERERKEREKREREKREREERERKEKERKEKEERDRKERERKEKEERDRQENERKEIQRKLIEEKERKERERLEREERDRQEREERERQEREERERVEREERERLEIEERERKEREERERLEREERERIEREERERQERERLEREERERQQREERERLEREEKERKERERREIQRKLIEEREKKERERKEKEEKEKKEKEKKERDRKEREEIQRKLKEERERKEKEEKAKREKEKKEREEIQKKLKEEREKKEKEEKEKREKEKKEKEDKDKKEKHVKLPPGPVRPNKMMMGGNFAKMLADKLKMAPPGARRGGPGGPQSAPKPPIVQENVNMAKILEDAPFEERTRKRKPSRKVFIEKIDKDDD